MISQTQHNHPTRTLSPDQSTETALVSLTNRMNLGDEHTRARCIKSPGHALCCAVLGAGELEAHTRPNPTRPDAAVLQASESSVSVSSSIVTGLPTKGRPYPTTQLGLVVPVSRPETTTGATDIKAVQGEHTQLPLPSPTQRGEVLQVTWQQPSRGCLPSATHHPPAPDQEHKTEKK
ncbi:uncharacterized protein ASPGLDRAFT_25363 [Aspergillus glaucus CBS 516.65]|uniref:Uncharacterized protein n=1 Tax=Aspergillus glaucus CBS 516.65 TaxID=1160497 RepID=A0A1L9VLD9_ASPGL|nr:hypothetical protein ASPGLDRAFT_25363 [Aspergillus glaucus CBS 516.65]OJJ84692.1 hypothetical protein ASPGLDRAFT_25363 [Aspergillus glaucus CBS 516.65]